ncbi:Rhodanese-like protein [Microthyrium microscopicum]|uniref:Rhodanese-like protein n=1 Tax=Microthyrium microscopicum TaxID=703497 RepID=A0A6A6UC77_9PEZI|nr:Rhodanese-like protein [Microthyrium microscopicum]
MATRRTLLGPLATLTIRSSVQPLPARVAQFRTYTKLSRTIRTSRPNCTLPYLQSRLKSSATQEPWQVLDFSLVEAFQAQSSKQSNDKGPLIIDVREPSEYAAGRIPNSINIPVNSSPESWSLDSEAFEDTFGFEKPDSEREVLVYCKAGIRSARAAKLAVEAGYGNVKEYRGSWDDWVAKGGKIEH